MTDDESHHNRLKVDLNAMSNERTILAYVRTALSFLAAGVGSIKLLEDDPAFDLLGLALIGTGALVLAFGLWRFARYQARLNQDRKALGV